MQLNKYCLNFCRYHIPRVLSLFTVIYGLSGVSTTFLRFLSDHGIPSDDDNSISQINKTDNLLCVLSRNATLDCITKGHGDSSGSIYRMKVAFILLCLFMGIQGFGKAPRSSLGTFYIDSNVPDKTRTGFYLGRITKISVCIERIQFHRRTLQPNHYYKRCRICH